MRNRPFVLLLCACLSLSLAACSDHKKKKRSGGGTTPATYTVGGMVTGLNGTLVLQNNGGDDLTLVASGSFNFATALTNGTGYAVSVLAQPAGQTCSVSHGSGTVNGANVHTVAVSCLNYLNTIGGTVSGLNGTLVLQNDTVEQLTITANGGFTFPTPVGIGLDYYVTVISPPPGQNCVISNGSGVAAGTDVTNIQVACSNNHYSVGGMLSGLAGTVVLRNNGGDDLTLNTAGAFTFATELEQGTGYAVTVLSDPADQTCSVVNGAGTINGIDVTGVTVTCLDDAVGGTPTLSLDYGLKQLRFAWTAVGGAHHYRLFENPDGGSGFAQVGGDLTTTAYDHTIFLPARVNARYLVEACNLDNSSCNASAEVAVSATLVEAIGYVKASNTQGGDEFGFSVALSDDGATLAVGAIQEASNATGVNGDQFNDNVPNAGAVYVFARDAGTGAWAQQAYVKPSNTQAPQFGSYYHFGWSVTLDGDGNTLAVGAPAEPSASATTPLDRSAQNAGAVYVYTRNGSGAWSHQAYLKASNAGLGDFFGFAVALSDDGDTLAVGARGEGSGDGTEADDSASAAGAVYVLTRTAGTWTQQAYVKASAPAAGADFGGALALSADGDTLAVGAVGAAGGGAAYVFTRSLGSWSEQAGLTGSNLGNGDFFGAAVALDAAGDVLAVGAPGDDGVTDAVLDGGGAYVFTRSGSTWAEQAYVHPATITAGDGFGGALALDGAGDSLAVGATGEGSTATGIDGNALDEGAVASGAVYLFARDSGTWSKRSYVKASNTTAGDAFGYAVGLDAAGVTLAVGALLEDSFGTGIGSSETDDASFNTGAVYLY